MTLPWDNLRADIDLRNSFEELCCQLARYEQVPDGSEFVRKGTPDAGVECYWRLSNNDEFAWQAKYFRNSLSSQQWAQIDDSVKTAIEKHPNLKQYTICLPQDRPDGRQAGQSSSYDKWTEHKEKWEKEKPGIEFNFWGNFEIEERLSKEEHHGRHKYFFNKNFFPSTWFEKRLKESVANAGTRYTPELNIKLQLSEYFETLGRTKVFYDGLKIIAGKINEEYTHGTNLQLESEIGVDHALLKTNIDKIFNILTTADKIEQDKIDFKTINNCTKICSKIIEQIFLKISKIKSKLKKTKIGSSDYSTKQKYERILYHFKNLQDQPYKLETMSETDSLLVANTSALLLNGDAGTGKTHLFCDIALRRIKNKQPTILILGGHFKNDNNPKQQILDEFRIEGSFDEFLQSLESVAQAQKCKVLFMIDALNEGNGKQIWHDHLSGILETFSRYPWIGVAFSVRTTYEEDIIPSTITPEKLSRFTHTGFTLVQEDALKIFFDNNGIQRPSIPSFDPEFSNPLFLKILCQGLRNAKYNEIPQWLKGITSVYDFFINTINKKISERDYLDYSEHENKVRKAINSLIELFNEKNSTFIEYEKANDALQPIYPSTIKSQSLLHHLISEGILNDDINIDESKRRIHVVRFAYEQLADNLLVHSILEHVKNESQLLKLFNKKGKFGKYFENKQSLSEYKGIINAILIQIPEKFEIELIQIIPKFTHPIIMKSFITSFIWRHPSSIKESTQKLIDTKILKNDQYRNEFLKIILAISGDPKSSLNALYLNKYLKNMDLSSRDAIWSIFLHHEFLQNSSFVNRWIEWTWHGNKSNLDPQPRYLLGMLLSWFLTSSNRFIRDTTTKALVSLLFEHMDILQKILREFKKCNDPYVAERLWAVSYGCVMKSNNKEHIKLIAIETFTQVFKNGNPPPNLLLRDYAKGIIDYARFRKIKLKIDYARISPPYKTKWINYPTKTQMEKLRAKSDRGANNPEIFSIFDSLDQTSDFYLYILGGNSNSFKWKNIKLHNGKSRETLFKEFVGTITVKQKIYWDEYYELITQNRFSSKDNQSDQIIKESKNNFCQHLNKKQKELFLKYIIPYIEHDPSFGRHENNFELNKLNDWIIKRVFNLGWSVEKFGHFDQQVRRQWSTRTENKPERISKKYQWIAFEELLARISDNYELSNFHGERAFQPYEGAWQVSVRDIDPSITIDKTRRLEQTSCWWVPFEHDAEEIDSDDDWLINSEDLPELDTLLQVTNPKDQSEWFVLKCNYTLQQPISPEENEYVALARNILIEINSSILKQENTQKCYEWEKNPTHHDSRFPDNDYDSHAYLGEYYWNKSVQSSVNPGEISWTDQTAELDQLPSKVYAPMYEYSYESEYDCSVKGESHIFVPNKLLVEKMNLMNKSDGTFVDQENNIVAFDPSVFKTGPSALLVRKEKFLEFLSENNYNIIWQIIGQKIMMGAEGRSFISPGGLNIHGMYFWDNDKITGSENNEI